MTIKENELVRYDHIENDHGSSDPVGEISSADVTVTSKGYIHVWQLVTGLVILAMSRD